LPQVASDPVIQRPLRPEPPGRAGVSSGEQSGSFEVLLDNGSAPPRTERPERASRTRTSDRTDQARADDRNQARAETRRSQDTGERASASNETKPADAPNTRQVKNGQPSDTGAPVANAAVTAAATAPAPAVDFTAIVAAVTADAGDAKPETTDTGKPAVTTDPAADGGKDTDAVAADTKTADVAAAVIVAVATPVPTPAIPLTSDPTADTVAVAPIAIEATAPAIPADAASPGAPALPATPDIATPPGAAPAKPQTAADAAPAAPIEKTAPSDDSQKAVALKAAGLAEPIETPDAKSPAPADRKADSGKAKSDRPGAVARATDAQPRSETAKSATDTTADQSPKTGPHQPHTPSAEHASPAARAAVADARAELPATAAAPAQLNAGAPAMPFNIAAPLTTPLAMPPVVALHVDPSSDNAIPFAGLAVEIVSRAQDGLKRFDIRLDPPELGRIDVRLDVDSGGKVTSRLVVERAETLDLLRRDAPQLERALQHAGLNTEGGMEFSLRDQNFANRDQGSRDLPMTHLIVPDDEPAATEAARRGYGRLIGLGGGVDIRV